MTNRYKILLVLVLVVGVVVLGWASFVWAPSYIAAEAPASIMKLNTIGQSGTPDAIVQDVGLNKLNLKDLASAAGPHKVVIVHFWASWCGPCVEELPSLIEFARANDEVKVFAIADDAEIQAAVGFYSKFKKPSDNFQVLFDQDLSAAQKFGTEKLPESFIFCKGGKFLQKFGSAVAWAKLELSSYAKECQ